MVYKISILGAQGSGKGTQAELLSKKLHIPAISMGQLFRDEAARGSQRSQIVKNHIDNGILVPEHITKDLLTARLSNRDTKKGYIIDGFPRRNEQYNFFQDIDTFTHVLVIQISDEEAIHRLSGRRIGPNNEVYHIDYNPPPNGIELTIRDDDKSESIKERLKTFHKETEPVIELYKKKVGIVHEINGEQSIEKVHQDILSIFGS